MSTGSSSAGQGDGLPGGGERSEPAASTGGLYDIHIRLALPDGREVNVERTAPADERRADLNFAINDAFKRARRQLQDQARRTQGQVKHHDEMPIATVARLDPSGEFGFLETADGREMVSPQQRSQRRLCALGRGLACDLCRGIGRKGRAGEHRTLWANHAFALARRTLERRGGCFYCPEVARNPGTTVLVI